MVGPQRVELQEGTKYMFCTCGKSSKGAFCDGSHKGLGFKPQIFTVDASKNYTLCGCKKSSRMPYCDGSHAD